jgi:hypothetical protein
MDNILHRKKLIDPFINNVRNIPTISLWYYDSSIGPYAFNDFFTKFIFSNLCGGPF